jgi:hypothetical protein
VRRVSVEVRGSKSTCLTWSCRPGDWLTGGASKRVEQVPILLDDLGQGPGIRGDSCPLPVRACVSSDVIGEAEGQVLRRTEKYSDAPIVAPSGLPWFDSA